MSCSSSGRKEQAEVIIKRFTEPSGDELSPKVKKTSINPMKRRIQPTDDDDENDIMPPKMFELLNTLKQDNLVIMRRLDILEEKLNKAPVSNTSAKTTQNGAFLS